MSEGSADRILFLLKTRAPLTAGDLARDLGITAMGVRQHLARLESDGLVAFADERRSVGRPKRYWSLTEKAETRFPDSHAQVAVELIAGMASLFGSEGLDRVIALREAEMLLRYHRELDLAGSLAKRVKRLAELRNAEGYMAAIETGKDGSYLLVENHCPICAVAKACQGFCRSELSMFQALLAGCTVERIDHILAGARRCAYRITPGARSSRTSSRDRRSADPGR